LTQTIRLFDSNGGVFYACLINHAKRFILSYCFYTKPCSFDSNGIVYSPYPTIKPL